MTLHLGRLPHKPLHFMVSATSTLDASLGLYICCFHPSSLFPDRSKSLNVAEQEKMDEEGPHIHGYQPGLGVGGGERARPGAGGGPWPGHFLDKHGVDVPAPQCGHCPWQAGEAAQWGLCPFLCRPAWLSGSSARAAGRRALRLPVLLGVFRRETGGGAQDKHPSVSP